MNYTRRFFCYRLSRIELGSFGGARGMIQFLKGKERSHDLFEDQRSLFLPLNSYR